AAAEFGLPYAFAHFFFGQGTRQAIEAYQRDFTASSRRAAPEAMAAVGVICAETDEEAEFLASSVRLLQRRIRMNDRRPVAAPEDAMRELAALGGRTPGGGGGGPLQRRVSGRGTLSARLGRCGSSCRRCLGL